MENLKIILIKINIKTLLAHIYIYIYILYVCMYVYVYLFTYLLLNLAHLIYTNLFFQKVVKHKISVSVMFLIDMKIKSR